MHIDSNLTKTKTKYENVIRYGESLMVQKKFIEATEWYAAAQNEFPTDAHLIYCKGVAQHQNKQMLEAIYSYCEAINIKSNFPEAFENLAQAQGVLHLYEDALLSINQALKVRNKKAITYSLQANILIRLCRFEEAIDAATNAIKLDKKLPDGYCSRSNAYRGLNKLKESIQDLQKAMALAPNDPLYPFNLSIDYLLLGEFEKGWQLYESRFKTPNFIQNKIIMKSPKWTGKESIKDKTLLILPEQGLGDKIQFARYALLAREKGAKVILVTSPTLIKVIKSMLGNEIDIVTSEQPVETLPEHDFHCHLMSMPLAFKTNINSIPKLGKYIAPSVESNIFWLEKLRNKKRPRIGICWSGNTVHVNDHNRSMELKELEPLLNLDIDWHIIQTDIRQKDELYKNKYKNLYDWRNELVDFDRTSGLIENLDLVITIDTSIVHLSASMGKEAWLMLPFAPDYRWLLNIEYSHWYDTIKIFRQEKPCNWSNVITNIHNQLKK
jgi:tetratricopeptide (TPR) repeat protein